MKIIEPDVIIMDKLDGPAILRKIEMCGRTCYKSEDKMTDDSAERFVRAIIKRGHESVLEHVSITVKIVCDRGVSHEIVRHRIASYSQESTRYCRYADGVTFVKPQFFGDDGESEIRWRRACKYAEEQYIAMLDAGAPPQEARAVLPNSTKTELIMTANLREWRHFLKVRAAADAHPDMRAIAQKLLYKFAAEIPVVFDDIVGRDRDD